MLELCELLLTGCNLRVSVGTDRVSDSDAWLVVSGSSAARIEATFFAEESSSSHTE